MFQTLLAIMVSMVFDVNAASISLNIPYNLYSEQIFTSLSRQKTKNID